MSTSRGGWYTTKIRENAHLVITDPHRLVRDTVVPLVEPDHDADADNSARHRHRGDVIEKRHCTKACEAAAEGERTALPRYEIVVMPVGRTACSCGGSSWSKPINLAWPCVGGETWAARGMPL